MFWSNFIIVINQTTIAQDPGLIERKSLYSLKAIHSIQYSVSVHRDGKLSWFFRLIHLRYIHSNDFNENIRTDRVHFA